MLKPPPPPPPCPDGCVDGFVANGGCGVIYSGDMEVIGTHIPPGLGCEGNGICAVYAFAACGVLQSGQLSTDVKVLEGWDLYHAYGVDAVFEKSLTAEQRALADKYYGTVELRKQAIVSMTTLPI